VTEEYNVLMANGTIAIDATDLRKHYGSTKAVDGISFQVAEGEIFGMLGPNGAGKSTTIEMIEGLRNPDAGAISVLGLKQPRDRTAIKKRIGIQLQTTALYPNHTVIEVIDLFRSFYPGQNTLPTDELVELVDLREKRTTRSKDLSGGQRQRLSLALALVNDPDVIFLDEPTSALDPQARRQVWDVIKEMQKNGKTLLLTTHYMEEAQLLCERVAIIDHGQIIEMGSPNDLIHRYFQDIAIEFENGHADVAAYRKLPGVVNVTSEENKVTIYTNDVPQTMASLINDGSTSKSVLRGLNVHSATLEDVFLKLTGRALRD
jgi:ABC-2 type transport system ATP-binding protein